MECCEFTAEDYVSCPRTGVVREDFWQTALSWTKNWKDQTMNEVKKRQFLMVGGLIYINYSQHKEGTTEMRLFLYQEDKNLDRAQMYRKDQH